MEKLVYCNKDIFVLFGFDNERADGNEAVCESRVLENYSLEERAKYYLLNVDIYENIGSLSKEQISTMLVEEQKKKSFIKKAISKFGTSVLCIPPKQYIGKVQLLKSANRRRNINFFKALLKLCDCNKFAIMDSLGMVPFLKNYNSETFIVTKPQIEDMCHFLQSKQQEQNEELAF